MKTTPRYRRNLGIFFLLTTLVLYGFSLLLLERYEFKSVSVPFTTDRMVPTTATFISQVNYAYHISLEAEDSVSAAYINDANSKVEVISQRTATPVEVRRFKGSYLGRFETEKGDAYQVTVTPGSPSRRIGSPKLCIAVGLPLNHPGEIYLAVFLFAVLGCGFLLAGIYQLGRYGFSRWKARQPNR